METFGVFLREGEIVYILTLGPGKLRCFEMVDSKSNNMK